MDNKQAALIKLAQVRCAINHVLRMRAMQKQARDPDWLRNLEMSEEVNGAVGIPTPSYVHGTGGTIDKARTMARYEHPENFPATRILWPFHSGVRAAQEKVKRLQKQLPPEKVKEYEQWKEPQHNVTPSATPSASPVQPNVVPLPPGTFQPGGLFPFR